MYLPGGGRDGAILRPQAQGRRVGAVGHRAHPALALLRLRGAGPLEPREWEARSLPSLSMTSMNSMNSRRKRPVYTKERFSRCAAPDAFVFHRTRRDCFRCIGWAGAEGTRRVGWCCSFRAFSLPSESHSGLLCFYSKSVPPMALRPSGPYCSLSPLPTHRRVSPLHPFLQSRPLCALLRVGWPIQFFYVLLDGALPPTPDPLSATTAVKVVVDQFVQAPIFTVVIFGVSTSILKHRV